MKTLKKAAFALAVLAFAAEGQAMVTPLGSIGPAATLPIGIDLPWSGPFSNQFSFRLLSGNAAEIGLTTSFWGDHSSDAPAFTFELQGGSGGNLSNPLISVSGGELSVGEMLTGLTTGQDYTLTINGSDASNLGTGYLLQIAAATVPEPDSAALVLGALGLLGGLARNRKKSKEESPS